MVIDYVALGEVEEGVVLQERVLEVIRLDGRDADVGGDASAAVDGASAVSEFHFAVGRVGTLGAVAVVVIVVERDVRVVALNQTSAGRVVVRRGQGQAGIFRQRIDGLHQSLAERDFTYDQAAVVILNCARDDFGGGSGQTIDEYDDGIILAAVA